MVLMLSWIDGQCPSLDLLQEGQWAVAMVTIMAAVDDDRHIRLYAFDALSPQLTLVYPSASRAVVKGQLIPK
jgi:hypothetical protein